MNKLDYKSICLLEPNGDEWYKVVDGEFGPVSNIYKKFTPRYIEGFHNCDMNMIVSVQVGLHIYREEEDISNSYDLIVKIKNPYKKDTINIDDIIITMDDDEYVIDNTMRENIIISKDYIEISGVPWDADKLISNDIPKVKNTLEKICTKLLSVKDGVCEHLFKINLYCD